MMGRRQIPRRPANGFTLVELLVVMVLLSLLVLAMGSALRAIAQTEERVDDRLQRMDEMRTAVDFLHDTLGRVSMAKTAAPVSAGGNPYLFVGTPRELVWIGIMPARYGAGGRYYFRLALEGTGPDGALVMRYVPLADERALPNWSSAAAYVLVRHAVALAFSYEDAMEEPPAWGPQWASIDRLPTRASITLATANGQWPDIVVPMRALPLSDATATGAVFGGSR